MRFHWSLPLLATLFLNCASERLAGTEVGNPELTLSARFSVTGNNDSMAISVMNLNCMGMAYYKPPGVKTMIWATPDGHMVDVASLQDSMELPPMKVNVNTWSKVDVLLKFPLGDTSLPNLISYQAFNNIRYAKLRKKIGSDTIPFLFEMPGNMELKLAFSKTSIDSWQHGDSVNMEITFDGNKWMEEIPQDLPNQTRRDGLGMKYIVIAPSENTAAYARLKAMLPLCFRADSTEMH